MNLFRYSLNQKRFTYGDYSYEATAQCLGIHVILANSSLVRSLLKGTHMRLHSL